MEFGICFKGFVSPERARYLVRQAEVGGFTYCWFYDSHILWRDCYAAIAMCMEHTQKIRFGPCVTNPIVRDWSVAGSKKWTPLIGQCGSEFKVESDIVIMLPVRAVRCSHKPHSVSDLSGSSEAARDYNNRSRN